MPKIVDVLGQANSPAGLVILDVWPQIDCGRYPVKREVGDLLEVWADILKEGHDKIAAMLKVRRVGASEWTEVEMTHVGSDRWTASYTLTENARCEYTIEAFPDPYATFVDELAKKRAAGLQVDLEIREGLAIISAAKEHASAEIDQFDVHLNEIESATSQRVASELLLSEDVVELMRRYRSRADSATLDHPLEVIVDRIRARFAAWYELFPRSAGLVRGQSGTFHDVIKRIPAIAALGFDVLYFPPIHPIGRINRKGKNNSVHAKPDDPGVPYAIGNELGGHDAIEPSLGTLEDFRCVVETAAKHGMEVALDFAIQAAPDHPWAAAHPEWFHVRADGSIKYAENPPKKYEDIYPINFHSRDWKALWQEMKRLVLFWVDQGVTTIRVDNPHTKPLPFWEWLIAEVQREHPEVIFLSEAFTRPKMMKALAKAGFTQSYTYFTWRNFKQEIAEYFTELTQSDVKEYLRGNLFPTTPDILPYILQEGGRPAFKMRLALAATLSSVYGLYSGYEVCEAAPVPGKEEFLNSEKYEYKVWDWDRPGNIVDYVGKINAIRRDNPALHEYDNLRFYSSDDENILCYGKMTPEKSNIIIAVVNLDPFHAHESWIRFPLQEVDIAEDEQYRVDELITGESFFWTGGRQLVRLDPDDEPAKFFSLRKWAHIDYAEPCF
ncbi:MAG: alpha-1,4-glucan--maltose-1-phosphate maltosyltransferase [Thermomicrobiales bacterium]